jgi:hypothetical protein
MVPISGLSKKSIHQSSGTTLLRPSSNRNRSISPATPSKKERTPEIAADFNKRLLNRYGKFSIFLVDAHAVRDSSVKNEDFGDYGINAQFPIIPEDEGWVSDELDKEGRRFAEMAAVEMLDQLAKGKSVDEAADFAEEHDAKARWIHGGGKGKIDHVPPEAIKGTYAKTDGGKVEILLVDGEVIRKEVDVRWIQGGNPQKFPWVKKGTLIIESTLPDDEKATASEHEFIEDVDMAGGAKYLDAHPLAAKIEFKDRGKFDKSDVEAMTTAWAKEQIAEAKKATKEGRAMADKEKGPKGYHTTHDKDGGVTIKSNKTGKSYHEPTIAAAKKLAHMHEVWSHMGHG